MTKAFQLLHPTVQRKLWDMKWTELRQIQVDAIEHLLGGTPTDCIISSPTASGKTEAAFLPVLSAIADDPAGGIRSMYIGPLKALINDQFGRIEELCTRMEMPVHRWHGDVEDSARKAVLAAPSGVLLITPESLEAMFVLRPTRLQSLFGRLGFVVIDEAHAFLGTQRGAQLISQLHRLRVRTATDAIRIGLSATLGDRDAARRWLRRDGRPVRVIASSAGSSEIRLRLRGLWKQDPKDDPAAEDGDDPSLVEIARGILVACHGKTNLVFANAKSMIEALADELTTQAKAMSVGDEIVVHHGSLSKDEREHAEERLRSGRPCTAVCSNTLELGIDIGSIDEVVQVSPPWSVASLVQRLGRSGRRPGSARILRAFFVETVPGVDATVWERLHLDFIRGLATIELMLESWLEAPDVDRANLSTLVQQILSSLAETGGIRAHELYPRLAESGAFPNLRRSEFATLLKELGARDLLEQLPDSTLVLGLKGQRIVEHYSFYAAFKSPTEFQVLHRERTIGALPESLLPAPGEHLILAGRRWLVEDIDVERRQVYVSPSRGRRPPRFASGQPDAAPNLHARMRALLLKENVPAYGDDTAADILRHARLAARDARIEAPVHVLGDRTVLSLWAGTRIQRTLFFALASAGLRVVPAEDIALEVYASADAWLPILRRFVEAPDGRALAIFAEDKFAAKITDGEKFDVFLPAELWRASYARERLDIGGAVRVATRLIAEAMQVATPNEAPAIDARVVSIPDIERWAGEVVALEAREPLPKRVVLVPSEAHAHALRVHLVEHSPEALAGTRFFTAAAAARSVLDHSGLAYKLGEEILRPLRLRKLLRAQPRLTTYRVEDLWTPGWENAFASTVEQLESAALRPQDLERLGEPRATDLAIIWRALDADAGTSWTIPRIMDEARARLLSSPGSAWPFDAPVLAAVPISIDAAHARFLRAIPRITFGAVPGRPARRRGIDRIRALLGADAATAIAAVPASGSADELGLLTDFLFEAPDRLAASGRRRSVGADGSVSLELHAGIDEELNAMARWVAEEVFDHGTRLQDIAILVPNADPTATLIADRIRGLSWPTDVEPVYLACGRPVVSTASGARLLAVVNALQSFLPAASMVELLPRLRLADDDGHVTSGRARAVVTRLGTIGGSGARPQDAVRWRDRLRRPTSGDSDADTLDARVEASVRALAPAIEALVAIAADLLSGASLSSLWQGIRVFATTYVIGPKEMLEIVDQLTTDLASFADDPVTNAVVGVEACALIASRLSSMRLHSGRYGEPAIYVGTIAGAAGLRFSAVRMLGLAEGAFPGTLREDAILPAELRRRLPAYAMPSEDDYATARLHAFDQVVRGVTKRLVLSVPRTDLDGSEREPASLLVEVAAALGRPNAITGEPPRVVVPTIADLERDAFHVARTANTARVTATPLSASCWLQHVAQHRDAIPSTWCETPVTDPVAMVGKASSMDGILGPAALSVNAIGNSAERPLSASALRMLLTCPQRFLLERLLRFRPRTSGADSHRIDPASYGALFHAISETFSREHGLAFGARHHELVRWFEVADSIACTRFDAFLTEYPLLGDGVVDNERRRLRRDVRTLIEDDWDSGRPRTFVSVEREFGTKSKLSLPTSAGPLFVTGRIDRIDIDQGITLVRDLKTGRTRPRERDEVDPDVDVDLQLALYVAIARRMAVEWSIPADVAAAYVYVDPLAPVRERAFRADRHALESAGGRWFDLAMSLVRDQTYVQTPNADDCGRCPFSAVCGDDSTATAERLQDATGTLGAFRDLKA